MDAREYTTPLNGTPYFRSVGIIKATDKMNYQYNIGEVSYERFDDQNFQYVFQPYWRLIEHLPENVFDGIPGIDTSIKKERYYRVNMTPSFISKRTPSESREDVRELLEEVGLDYYDRFEWLIRTDKRCGDDNLFVVRKRMEPMEFDYVNDEMMNQIQLGDKIILPKLSDIALKRSRFTPTLFRLMQSGATIHIKEDDIVLSIDNCNPLYILERLMRYEKEYMARMQKIGVEKAKSEGKYKGRQRKVVDEFVFKDIVERFERGCITEKQAIECCGISRSTFYRRMREYRNKGWKSPGNSI